MVKNAKVVEILEEAIDMADKASVRIKTLESEVNRLRLEKLLFPRITDV